MDCTNWFDHMIRVVLSKLGVIKHSKLVNYILPKKKTSDEKFKETVSLLSGVFRPKTSLFHKRWKCRDLIKNVR